MGPELLRRTIALVHPDRHPGREQEATAVTRELLALREQIVVRQRFARAA
jgi:hypothetical protein